MKEQKIVFIKSHWLLVTVILAFVALLVIISSIKLWSYNLGEASNHVKNSGTISVESVQEKAELEDKINKIAGVVECGFFTKNIPEVFVSYSDGTVERF